MTYNKHPLYTFASAGKGTSGEGVNGFYVVSTSWPQDHQARYHDNDGVDDDLDGLRLLTLLGSSAAGGPPPDRSAHRSWRSASVSRW